jgi:signal transduction histidine kinase/ActR/RegA family two-component response regulator
MPEKYSFTSADGSLTRLDEKSSRAILHEQVRALYKSLPPILLIHVVVASMMMYALWEVESQVRLRLWAAAMLVVILVRLLLYLLFRRSPEHTSLRYAYYFVAGSSATGLAWGVGGVLLFPQGTLEYQLFILFVLMGMGAGAVTSLTAFLPAFYAYLLPSLLPVGVMLILVADPMHTALGVMSLAYITALTFFAHNVNRSFVQTLMLRFENINLVKELSEKKEQAEQANIAKSRFLAAASHDLRQPLHALTLFTSVLDQSIQYPKVRKVVDQINASVHALQSLFNALLDISRLEAGVMVAEKIHFRLQPLFDKLANEYNPQAGEKHLDMNWPRDANVVYSDPVLLEQILRNYLSNAIRYTSKGSVSVRCYPMGDLIRLEVADTGEGIPVDEQRSIFREFHQLNNPERDRSKGLGLGLAIVERIARLLEHDIDLRSAPGKGSSFFIDVPVGDDSNVNAPQVEALSKPAGDISNVAIVVIDDEISVRQGMESLLQNWNSHVVSAADDEEAIKLLREQDKVPDGIIADYRLRAGKTGLDVIQRLHEEFGQDIPALIVTGDIAEETLRTVKESGFQLLHKPVAPVKLRAFLLNVQKRKNRN